MQVFSRVAYALAIGMALFFSNSSGAHAQTAKNRECLLGTGLSSQNVAHAQIVDAYPQIIPKPLIGGQIQCRYEKRRQGSADQIVRTYYETRMADGMPVTAVYWGTDVVVAVEFFAGSEARPDFSKQFPMKGTSVASCHLHRGEVRVEQVICSQNWGDGLRMEVTTRPGQAPLQGLIFTITDSELVTLPTLVTPTLTTTLPARSNSELAFLGYTDWGLVGESAKPAIIDALRTGTARLLYTTKTGEARDFEIDLANQRLFFSTQQGVAARMQSMLPVPKGS